MQSLTQLKKVQDEFLVAITDIESKAQQKKSGSGDGKELEKLWFDFSNNHAQFSNEFIGKIVSLRKKDASQLAGFFGSYVQKCYEPALLSYKNSKIILEKNRNGKFHYIIFFTI